MYRPFNENKQNVYFNKNKIEPKRIEMQVAMFKSKQNNNNKKEWVCTHVSKPK